MTSIKARNGRVYISGPTAITDLRNARALITDEAKWCQGTLRSPGRLCAWQAILEACGRDLDRAKAAASHLEFYIRGALRTSSFRPIIAFNDTRNRQHAEVMALFDAAGVPA